MPTPSIPRLRIAAINFLNPAPLLYHFEHDPTRAELLIRYQLHYTLPALCADQLRTGEADLGLIPIAALPSIPDLTAVPGCVIASLHQVRSIQLILKPGLTLGTIRTVAADSASRSSAAYLQVLLRAFYNNDPAFEPATADLPGMLAHHDAALLIGDPALLALEARDHMPTSAGHSWLDVATLWHRHTGLPWVAAVWAVRPAALARNHLAAHQLLADLAQSRDAGLANVDRIVHDWQHKIAIPAETIRTYLTRNIHYTLDTDCLASIHRFYQLARQTSVLPCYQLNLLQAAD